MNTYIELLKLAHESIRIKDFKIAELECQIKWYNELRVRESSLSSEVAIAFPKLDNVINNAKSQSQVLKIIKCTDPWRWYSDKVGEIVLFLRDTGGEYESREPLGISIMCNTRMLKLLTFEDAENEFTKNGHHE